MKLEFICQICGKEPSIGYHKPKSMHRTKKLVKPNLQKWQGFYICTKCRKTINKKLAELTPVKTKV